MSYGLTRPTADSIPLKERQTKTRNLVDALTTRYPAFVFGRPLGDVLPAFHFHEVEPQNLEAKFRYLADNGYHGVSMDEVSAFAQRGLKLERGAVALCFDDAWASLWTVAFPLLKRYNLRAITFVIPGRVQDATAARPALDTGHPDPAAEDRGGQPFSTWPELQAMHASGLVDVQSHTYSHARIFTSSEVAGFVTPEYLKRSYLQRALLSESGKPEFLGAEQLGAPVYAHRSRMSDGFRYLDDVRSRRRCMDYVAQHGGEAFFQRPNWKKELLKIAYQSVGVYENEAQRRSSITTELVNSRDVLNARLSTDTVRHICFPWTIAGKVAEELLPGCGYQSAFADRNFGLRAVRAGDNPYRMMRVSNRYIFALPGKGRRSFLSFSKKS